MLSLEKILQNALKQLEESKNFTKFQDAKKSLEQLDLSNGSPELQEAIEMCLSQATATQKRLNVAPSQIDSLVEFIEFDLPDSIGNFQKLFYTVCQEKLNKMEKDEQTWLKQLQINKPKQLESLDASACTSWLKLATDLPHYLSKDAVSRYETAKILVEERLHHQRVDGVVAMFQHLSPEEQKECLARLQQQ